jgi:hypothetical protein
MLWEFVTGRDPCIYLGPPDTDRVLSTVTSLDPSHGILSYHIVAAILIFHHRII